MAFTREQLLAEAQRRGLSVQQTIEPPAPRFSRDQMLAEAKRRGLEIPEPAKQNNGGVSAFEGVDEFQETYVPQVKPGEESALDITKQMSPEQVTSHIESIRNRKEGVISGTLDYLGQFGEGMRRAGEGYAQSALRVAELMGLDVPSSEGFTAATEHRRATEAPVPEGPGGLVAQIAGEAIPSLMVPPVVRGGLVGAGASNLAINSALSGATFTPEGESKLKQAAIGGGIGAGIGALGKGVRAAVTAKQSTKDMIEAFAEAGTTPTVGQATGNPIWQAVENTFGKFFGGQGISAKAAANAQKQLGQASEEAATKLTKGATDEMVGGVVRKGIDRFADDFRGNAEVLYRRLNDFVEPTLPAPVPNTLNAFNELTRITPGAERTSDLLASSNLKSLAKAFTQDASNGVIPFSALQEVRSSIGRKLSSSDLVSDYTKGELKKLYAAISKDMGDAAISAGGETAFKRANNFYKAGLGRIDNFLTPLAKKTEDIDIYNALVVAGKKGTQKLNAVKRSLSKNQWEKFVGSRIKDLGVATPGAQGAAGDVWSSANFLTNWNKINPNAKKVMFSGTPELVKYGKHMDSLAKAAESIKESAKVMANPSGTAGQLSTMMLSGLGGAGLAGAGTVYPAIAGILMGTAGAGSKILTSPKVINAIGKLPVDLPVKSLEGIIGRGTALYNSQDDAARDEIDFLINEVKNRS